MEYKFEIITIPTNIKEIKGTVESAIKMNVDEGWKVNSHSIIYRGTTMSIIFERESNN